MGDMRRNVDWYKLIIRSILEKGDKRDVNQWFKKRLQNSNRKAYEESVFAKAKADVYAEVDSEKKGNGKD